MSDQVDFRKTPKPEWLIQQEQSQSPVLDLGIIYSADKYWKNVVLTVKDPGMPAEHRLYLLDYLRQNTHLTELNMEHCNLSAHLKLLGDVLSTNSTLRKLNLRDNNLRYVLDVEPFLDMLETSNYALTELVIDEGNKTLEEKSKYLHESFDRGVVSNAVFANETEADVYRKQIHPRIKAYTAWNTKYIAPLMSGQGSHLELSFGERTPDKRGHPMPLIPSRVTNLFKTFRNQIKSLTIDKWLPPAPLEIADEREAFDKLGQPDQEAYKARYTLPDALFELPYLEDLRFYNMLREDEERDRSSNKRRKLKSSLLSIFPEKIGRLKRLKTLTMSGVGLKVIDASVLPYLAHLEILNLPANKLKVLPITIGNLKNLTRLSVHTNKLTELPDSILLLGKLETLLAYDNMLTRLPVGLPMHLKSLTDFKALNQLRNSLVESADNEKELKGLAARERIAIDKKPQPPFSELYSYLKQSAAGKVKLNRCKLIFVGDGNVGKTTTIRSLLKEANKKDENDPDDELDEEELKKAATNIATDGIEIHSLRVKAAGVKSTPGDLVSGSGDSIVFSCWDFAGQDIYYNTHQFFLSDRSIYMIGFNLEDEDETKSIARVEYWLQSINTRLPGVPIVIFGTHMEAKKCTKDYLKAMEKKLTTKYKKKFRVVENCFISNDSQKGIPELMKTLKAICKTKQYKKRLGIEEDCPKSYLLLEERAHSLRVERLVPTMSYASWTLLAKQDTGFNDTDVRDATLYLHDLGSLVWFDEDGLREVVILDAQWLTQVFSATISAKTNLSTGILKHEDLPWLWRSYPRQLHPFMLTVLEKFELLHRLEGNAINNVVVSSKLLLSGNMLADNPTPDAAAASSAAPTTGRSLIPCMLPPESPKQSDIDIAWPPREEVATELIRLYRFEFLPNGFFSRMMVRLLHSQWRASIFWKYGIVLFKDLARLFLRYDHQKKEISITVRGHDKGNKIGSLVESINTLIRDWLKESNIDIVIPYKGPDGKTTEVHVSEVEKLVASGQTTFANGVKIETIAPDLAMHGAVAGGNLTEAELNISKELGKGGFAIVYRGTLRGEPVAVKKLIWNKEKEESGEMSFSEVFAEFRREVWLMSSLQHSSIVALKGIATKPNLCMVLEFMEAGNLYDYIHVERPIEWEEKFKLATDVARGMRFMHSQNPPIIHRDLKTPNILLTKRGGGLYPTAKIADFGLSRGLVWTQSYSDKVVDNPVWLAPEVIQKKPYSEKVDVYAFGVILWEFASQQDFFGEVSFMSDMEQRIINGDRPPIPDSTPGFFRSLIELCWHKEAEKRPSFDQLVEALEQRVSINEAKPSIVNFTQPPLASQIRASTPLSGISSSSSIITNSSSLPGPIHRTASTPHVAAPLPHFHPAALSNSSPGLNVNPRTVSVPVPRVAPSGSVAPLPFVNPALMAQFRTPQPTAQPPVTVQTPGTIANPSSVPIAPLTNMMLPMPPLVGIPNPIAPGAGGAGWGVGSITDMMAQFTNPTAPMMYPAIPAPLTAAGKPVGAYMAPPQAYAAPPQAYAAPPQVYAAATPPPLVNPAHPTLNHAYSMPILQRPPAQSQPPPAM